MKILIISESQKEILLTNDKPSLRFDKKYGTTLSQRYEFPFKLSEDKIWTIYLKCRNHQWIKMGDDFTGVNRFRHTPEEYCDIWKKIVNGLNSNHFPYFGVEELPFNVKTDILGGMASNFNVDDIVHFSIDGIYGYNNNKVKNEIKSTFPGYISNDIDWVVSPRTLEKMKEQISVRKLNMRDYI